MSLKQSRTYGHGATGNLTSTTQKRHTLGARLRYRFDNSISRGQAAFAGWLLVIGLLISAVLAGLRWVVDGLGDGTAGAIGDLFMTTSNSVLFDGKVGEGTLIQRGVFFLVWLASVAISATIIGFIANRIRERADDLRSGKSLVIETGHTLILGWSNRALPIIQQLALAGANQRKSVITIFADASSEAIEDAVAARVDDMHKTKLVIRKGDPTNPKDLQRTNLGAAASIIVLDEDLSGDASVISTVLAIQAAAGDSQVPVIAEIDNPENADALRQATGGRVSVVQANQVIARVTAQASRQPGLAAVVLDLLDFEGDEIYFQSVPQLAGQTYGAALTAFNEASIVGLRHKNGKISLNPAMTTVIAEGDQVIAIAADDDRVVFNALRTELDGVTAMSSSNTTTRPEHLLVIGWSAMGNAVMEELSQFLPSGSSIHILADPGLVDVSELPSKTFNGIPVTFSEHTGTVASLAAAARRNRYDEIIVLAYRENIAVAEADARTMLTMLLLNRLFDEENNGVEPTRLVAEILDSRRAELARVAAADDLVVSDNLAALMMAQIAQNPEVSPVFTDLFDAEGASINVRPIELYVQPGSEVSYAELVASARARGESAIGYRNHAHPKGDPANGVALNPRKDLRLTPANGDALVVIGAVHTR